MRYEDLHLKLAGILTEHVNTDRAAGLAEKVMLAIMEDWAIVPKVMPTALDLEWGRLEAEKIVGQSAHPTAHG